MKKIELSVCDAPIELGAMCLGHTKTLSALVLCVFESFPDIKDEALAALRNQSEVDNSGGKVDNLEIGFKIISLIPRIVFAVHEPLCKFLSAYTGLDEKQVSKLKIETDLPLIVGAFFELNDFGKVVVNLKNAIPRKALTAAAGTVS